MCQEFKPYLRQGKMSGLFLVRNIHSGGENYPIEYSASEWVLNKIGFGDSWVIEDLIVTSNKKF